MHSVAAHYPQSPSAYERAHAAAFYRALAALYPCTHCREDFHASVAADPPRRAIMTRRRRHFVGLMTCKKALTRQALTRCAALRVESREALAVWLCGQHNAVNAKLGKPLFLCDFAALDARWRTGDKACFADDGHTAAQSLGQEP